MNTGASLFLPIYFAHNFGFRSEDSFKFFKENRDSFFKVRRILIFSSRVHKFIFVLPTHSIILDIESKLLIGLNFQLMWL